MTTPRLIACVGTARVTQRIEDDLAHNPRDRRLLIISRDDDCQRLRGLRGSDVAYVDLGASWYQRAFCKLREIDEISVDQARELLNTPQERIPNQ